jgi:hypothetical protein
VSLAAGWLRDPVAVAFVVAGGFCLCRCVSVAVSRRLADRVGYGAHALMCGSMVVMVWYAPPLLAWQMALFAIAGGWFAVQATGIRLASLRLSPAGAAAGLPAGAAADRVAGDATCASRGRGGRLRCAHHAAVMALMVWMLRGMTSGAGGMRGMLMPSQTLAGPAVVGGLYCAAVGFALVSTAGVAVWRRRHGRNRGTVLDDLAHGLMTAGMAAMLFAMA